MPWLRQGLVPRALASRVGAVPLRARPLRPLGSGALRALVASRALVHAGAHVLEHVVQVLELLPYLAEVVLLQRLVELGPGALDPVVHLLGYLVLELLQGVLRAVDQRLGAVPGFGLVELLLILGRVLLRLAHLLLDLLLAHLL